ncbi:MAG TPA: DEAD/DEAH box helicase, partial [Candidatus Polarisedimenticolia bacterium]|nr:DEAD/DEAH box helicase [Candidatus Polarisedimenticolia bacterium]
MAQDPPAPPQGPPAPPRKGGRLRQIKVVAIRPRGTPKDPPPALPERPQGETKALSAFPDQPVPFSSLDLPELLLRAIEGMGYTQATQVQAAAIPKARGGRDLIVQSRTGTGKTAAFGIPIIEKVDASLKEVQALILTPARELCLQVTTEMERLGEHGGVRALAIYGGDSMTRQIEGLKRGAQVVVGTPGRLLDLLRQGVLRLEAVTTLVLDEADQMLDMGFEKEVKQILDRVPKSRQTLLFSATIPSEIEAIASRYLKEPERMMLSQDFVYVSDVLHLFYIVTRMGKADALHKLIEWENPTSSMIFCNTRAEVRMVFGSLARYGLPAAMISSDLPQKKREQVMRRFKNKELKHLVATDVAARGIDIEDLSHVFIYSAPESSDQYIHRAGRTGRIGKTGKAISLVSGFDLMNFNRLVRANNLKAYECDLPSDEEVRQREVRRIVVTLKEQAGKLSAEERAEFDPMAQGILDQEDRVAIVAYLLKAHFEEEAARGVLDEAGLPDDDAGTAGAAAEEPSPGGGPGGGRGFGRRGGGHGGHGRSSGAQGRHGGGHRHGGDRGRHGGGDAAPAGQAAPAAHQGSGQAAQGGQEGGTAA